MKEINQGIQQQDKSASQLRQKTGWKYKDACYSCGKTGHWRKRCPERPLGKRLLTREKPKKKPTLTTDSTQTENENDTEATTKQVRLKKKKLAQKPQHYNPDLMARLFGKASDAPILINGEETTCLVDTGATVTMIDETYCQRIGLEMQPLSSLVKLIGTSGSPIPYSGYVIITVKFPHIPNYEEDVVMLVIRNQTEWADRVPIQIGTRIIAAVIEQIKPDLQLLGDTWKQTYVGTLMGLCCERTERRW